MSKLGTLNWPAHSNNLSILAFTTPTLTDTNMERMLFWKAVGHLATVIVALVLEGLERLADKLGADDGLQSRDILALSLSLPKIYNIDTTYA